MRFASVRFVLVAVLAACQNRFPAGARYAPSADSSVHVVYDAKGHALRLRVIGTVEDISTSIRINSVSDGTVLLVANAARSNLGKIDALRLKAWAATVRAWVEGAAPSGAGDDARNEIALDPPTTDERDETSVRVELSRSSAAGVGASYGVYLTIRSVSVWMRNVSQSEMARFVAALDAASDSSLAMSRARSD